MIRSFKGEIVLAAWTRAGAKGVPTEIRRTAYRKLMQINNARALNDLRSPPGNRLKALKGRPKGQCSVRINDQWRVCFRWMDGEAHDVEVCDYHDE